MSQNTGALTKKAQEEVARLNTAISKQRDIIKTETIVNEQKGDTYTCNRARRSLASLRARYDTLVEKHEATLNNFEIECEKKVKKLETECEAKIKEIEKNYEAKIQLLRDLVEPETDTYLTNYEKKVKAFETEMEAQDKVIHDETNKTQATIIRAKEQIKKLIKEKEDIFITHGLQKPTPIGKVSKSPEIDIEEEEQEEQEANTTEPSAEFKLFMLDGRQDGNPMSTETPSYLQGTAWGLCLTKKDKLKAYKNSEE